MTFKEPIGIFFSVEGLKIISDNWEIPCLPCFSITSFYNGETIQETEKLEYKFRLKTQDSIDNDILLKERFFYTTDCHQYNFEVATKPIDDITGAGLSYFRANFISREAL